MGQPFTPKIVAANALIEGDAVWLTEDDRWTGRIDEAELLDDEAHADLRLLFALTQSHVVDPYLADAKAGRRGPEPAHYREAFRDRGPSNYRHGRRVGDRADV